MANLTPAEIARKQIDRAKAAVNQTKEGVQRVTVAPGQRAAQSKARMLAAITEAINDGTWERRVAAVTLADWQAAMINKGIPRIGTGLEAAINDITDFHTKLKVHQNGARNVLSAMPKTTYEEREQRMVAWSREMRKFKR